MQSKEPNLVSSSILNCSRSRWIIPQSLLDLSRDSFMGGNCRDGEHDSLSLFQIKSSALNQYKSRNKKEKKQKSTHMKLVDL